MAWSPISFGDMFHSFVAISGDECVQVNIARTGELPPGMNEYGAIVITGSRFNCRDGEKFAWFEPLCEVIRLAATTGRQRIYGGCFGCQLIAYALGGKVDYNHIGRFVLKAEIISVQPWFVAKYLKNDCTLDQPASEQNHSGVGFSLKESHGDCVLSLPPGAELVGTSSTCNNEIFVAGVAKNILACQSHPEFELQYSVRERIWPAVVEKDNRIAEPYVEEYRRSFDTYTGEDAVLMKKAIAAFLHDE
eukprot:CAMPEP_0170382100 /NCGR_PEP_ID=MMETSP0117_2-20130122/14763_1 /TAXON_ID=400756 /ORGANISM="Durinskia baltica, Strain CSIRO CS-38" /LENGTH=247 /DNA_ID=CAMNT_0010637717 /DNA_START=71 /DNA_END=814 /DNA_ORIENTATION=+